MSRFQASTLSPCGNFRNHSCNRMPATESSLIPQPFRLGHHPGAFLLIDAVFRPGHEDQRQQVATPSVLRPVTPRSTNSAIRCGSFKAGAAYEFGVSLFRIGFAIEAGSDNHVFQVGKKMLPPAETSQFRVGCVWKISLVALQVDEGVRSRVITSGCSRTPVLRVAQAHP